MACAEIASLSARHAATIRFKKYSHYRLAGRQNIQTG
jgi:hypothetical protein